MPVLRGLVAQRAKIHTHFIVLIGPILARYANDSPRPPSRAHHRWALEAHATARTAQTRFAAYAEPGARNPLQLVGSRPERLALL